MGRFDHPAPDDEIAQILDIEAHALESAADAWEAEQGAGPQSDAPWLGKWLRERAKAVRRGEID